MQDYIVFRERRQKLIEHIRQQHGLSHGVVIIAGAYESEYMRFRQDSTFYYLTGIDEPACVAAIWLSGETYIYVPSYPQHRSSWVMHSVTPDSDPNAYKVDGIYAAGQTQAGIHMSPLYKPSAYERVIHFMHEAIASDVPICACVPDNQYAYVHQQQFLRSLERGMQEQPAYYDISASVANVRRTKSRSEIAQLHHAINTTVLAQEAAACALQPGKPEYYVQAAAEYIFTECGARPAFPSVIASGHRSTILHYADNSSEIPENDVAVVDIGAYADHYAADVTRTYPTSGSFSQEQARIYEAVRDTQAYIADMLAPGYYIYNAQQPDISLYHRAQERLKKHGFHEYFIHNIGHFLGLDVHDVGDIKTPLAEGDVITVEPGVYDAENGIGVRIEDDYWIVANGSVCLTESLPREKEEIERLAQRGFGDIGDDAQ